MRRLSVPLLALAVALALVALGSPALAAPSLQMTELMAELRGGEEEVPTPGDPDGMGTTTVTLDMGSGQITYTINVSSLILPAAAAHIHEGERGVAGPVVVPLTAPDANGMASGSVAVEAALMQRIQENPGGFYVNVHTSDYPNGAVRGQLMMGEGDMAGGTAGGASPSTLPNTAESGNSVPLALAGLALLALGAGLGLRLSLSRREGSR